MKRRKFGLMITGLFIVLCVGVFIYRSAKPQPEVRNISEMHPMTEAEIEAAVRSRLPIYVELVEPYDRHIVIKDEMPLKRDFHDIKYTGVLKRIDTQYNLETDKMEVTLRGEMHADQ